MGRVISNRSGQLLVEVMIGVAVVMVGLLAIMQISRKSVNNAGYSERQATATAYASEAIEWVRSQKETLGWAGLFGKDGSWCVNSLNWSTTNTCTTYLDTIFKRQLSLVSTGSQITVGVEVNWAEGSRTAKVTQDTILVKY